jgi:carboxypeptidase family protein
MFHGIARLPFVLIARMCAIASLWAATLAVAQQPLPQAPDKASIEGTVLDINGGAVPKATVVLQGTNEHRTTVADDNGFFKFDAVKPGTPLRIVISAAQLKNWTSNDIVLQQGQSFILTGIKLAVAPVETSVTAATPEEVAAEQVKIAEQQRVFGVIPNFYVTYEKHPAPLTPKLKFKLAFRALMDPVTILGFGVNAGIYQAVDYPSYGQGAAAYGQRLGATFAGGYAKIMIGDGVLASLLHQDPRYVYQGTGTTKSRLKHAIGSAFITRGDNGEREINWSDLGGDLAVGGLQNAYYPPQDRGPGLVLRGALIGLGGRMALGVFQEFVLPKWTSRHSSHP